MNEIRISGFGGQGVIRCGYIVGKTAAIFDNKHATLTQSFGPEARGSACSAQIIVDDVPIRYPYLTKPDTVVAMSQEAFDKFGSDITPGGTLMIDDDLVKPESPPKGCKVYAIPATRIAEGLGNRIAANIVMLGFFTAVTDIISVEAARDALPSSVPSRFIELNEKAFEEGYRFGSELLGKEPVPPPAERSSKGGEYRASKVTTAKAGRRATTLARVNVMDGDARKGAAGKSAAKSAAKEAAGAAIPSTAKRVGKRASSAKPAKRAGKTAAKKKAGKRASAAKKKAGKRASAAKPGKKAPAKKAGKTAARKKAKSPARKPARKTGKKKSPARK
ncbi:MAG: 2-oxoacid:acceptor oxidoreductase family protein [Candidatus Eisenbacteria bacterium]